MNVLEMARNFEKHFPGKRIINMTSWIRNQLTKLCNAVSAPVAATQDALAERLHVDGSTGDNYIRVEMLFNSLMAEFFEGSDINDLIQGMLAHIKTQAENPRMPESGFSLDKIMHLSINFHKLVLTGGSSYIEFSECLKSKKAMLNPQNKDEKCFKWAAIAALMANILNIILRELAC